MKKVVLLGDSIRLSYGNRVRELLGEGYTVWQPEDNCRFAAYTLRMLFDYKAQLEGADVIHFNCGLWDMCDLFGDGPFTPLEVYAEQMVRIAKILKTYAPVVIFAAPTPPGSCTLFSVLCTLARLGRTSASFPARLVSRHTRLKYASESFSFGGAHR